MKCSTCGVKTVHLLYESSIHSNDVYSSVLLEICAPPSRLSRILYYMYTYIHTWSMCIYITWLVCLYIHITCLLTWVFCMHGMSGVYIYMRMVWDLVLALFKHITYMIILDYYRTQHTQCPSIKTWLRGHVSLWVSRSLMYPATRFRISFSAF